MSNVIIIFCPRQNDSVENSSGYSIPQGYLCTLTNRYYVQTSFDRTFLDNKTGRNGLRARVRAHTNTTTQVEPAVFLSPRPDVDLKYRSFLFQRQASLVFSNRLGRRTWLSTNPSSLLSYARGSADVVKHGHAPPNMF